jgi:hypothetical protein
MAPPDRPAVLRVKLRAGVAWVRAGAGGRGCRAVCASGLRRRGARTPCRETGWAGWHGLQDVVYKLRSCMRGCAAMEVAHNAGGGGMDLGARHAGCTAQAVEERTGLGWAGYGQRAEGAAGRWAHLHESTVRLEGATTRTAPPSERPNTRAWLSTKLLCVGTRCGAEGEKVCQRVPQQDFSQLAPHEVSPARTSHAPPASPHAHTAPPARG